MPFRTAINKGRNYIQGIEIENEKIIFYNHIIGFSIKNIFDTNDFETEIKWKTTLDNKALKIDYVNELILFVNAHANRNNYNVAKIIFTHPFGNVDLVDVLNCINLEPELNNKFVLKSESIAPAYYYIRGNFNTYPFLNIDIGGGSTDIVYVKKMELIKYKSLSIRFAGGDVWGIGAFYNYFKDIYCPKVTHSSDKAGLASIFNYIDTKNDITNQDKIDYIFNDTFSEGRFKEIFVKNKNFILISILHNLIILYYVKDKIANESIRLVSITGTASKYLTFIPNEKRKEYLDIIKEIFNCMM
ncbi:MAG: hypothetical protein IPQ19_13730 [Bacteroidetes bacterium]|nr:hypothetical protein [Bacteroidota bacterium]